MHYLDNAATTKVSQRAASAVLKMMREEFGNPSSVHRLGIEAESVVESARAEVAAALHCDASEVYFTGSGTEGNNWAVFSGAEYGKRRGRHILTTAVEHSAVLNPVKRLSELGYEAELLPPERDGSIDLNRVEAAVRPDTALLSMMLVNNETGMLLPVKETGEILRRKAPEALFHVDAVQAFLKRKVSVSELSCDLLTVSAHKIHGPKGVGALYIRDGVRVKPFIYGGGQERGMRSGTEPVPLIAGFSEAILETLPHVAENTKKVGELRERLLSGLLGIPEVKVLASGASIVNFAFTRYPAEVTIRMLEGFGVYVSGGSACLRGRQSHVLSAMGVDGELIKSALRVSFSHTNTEADVDALISALLEL